MLFRYHDRLEGDARRWVEKGLVDEATAGRLLDESRSQTRGYSFTSIVVLLGVVCLCFAAMTFVAANWEEMPKLVRVGLIMTGLWAAYAMAVAARVKGHPAIADSFVVLGCGLFGVSKCLAARIQTFLHQVHYQLLQFGSGEDNTEVLGSAGISGDEGKINLGLLDGG